VWSVAWSPNDSYLASGSLDGTVQVWDAKPGRTRVTYRGHSASVWAISWSPDGTYLASTSKDRTVQVWEAMTSKLLLTYHGHSSEAWDVVLVS
jgi:WD40 repeat protein